MVKPEPEIVTVPTVPLAEEALLSVIAWLAKAFVATFRKLYGEGLRVRVGCGAVPIPVRVIVLVPAAPNES
jgi:hypothetical protein